MSVRIWKVWVFLSRAVSSNTDIQLEAFYSIICWSSDFSSREISRIVASIIAHLSKTDSYMEVDRIILQSQSNV